MHSKKTDKLRWSFRHAARLGLMAALTGLGLASAAVNTARFTVATSGSIAQNSTGNQTVTVTNVGPDTGTNVVATYKPPTTIGITVNSVTASPGGACTLGSGVYTCPAVPTVALNGIITLTVNMTIAANVPVGSSAGSTVIVNSAEFNPGSGAGESLFNIWGAPGPSGAVGDAFWFAFDGNYNNTGDKTESTSNTNSPVSVLTTKWPVNQANPVGAYNIKYDDPSYKSSDDPNDNAATASPSHPVPYNAYGTAAGTAQPPKNQSVVTVPPSVNLPDGGKSTSVNNRRVWEVRTGIYLNTAQPLYVCVGQPDDAMYVAIDPATSATIAAYAPVYTSSVQNSGAINLTAGYHEIVYRIFNRNNQSSSYENGPGGFGMLGIGTAVSGDSDSAAACSASNYNVFTKVAPASNVTVAAASADLSVAKSQRLSTTGTFQTTALSVAAGQTVQYQLVFTNNGPSSVTGATFTDAVPSNITGLSVISSTCTSATFAGNTLNGTFTGANAATCTVVVQGTASTAGTFTNTASIAVPSGITDPVSGNNSSSVSTTITPSADLVINKTGPAAVGSNGSFSYTITVWNNGPSVISAATITDSLPSGFTLTNIGCVATGTATCGTVGSTLPLTTGSLTLDSIPGNSQPDGNYLTYTVTGTAPVSGSLSNSASVTVPSGAGDPVPGNNTSATVTTRVVDAVNDPAASFPAGSGGTISVLGNDTIGGVPATTTNGTVTYVSGLAGVTVNAAGQLVVPTGAAPGSYTVMYKLCDISVATACDTATVSVTVTGGTPAITLQKLVRNIGTVLNPTPQASTTFGIKANGKPGDYLEYCIVYTNTGSGSATSLILNDTLQSGQQASLNGYGNGLGVLYANGVTLAAGDTAAPNGAGQSSTGTLTATQLTYSVGTLAAGGKGVVCFKAQVP